jgi:hypothetical protein
VLSSEVRGSRPSPIVPTASGERSTVVVDDNNVSVTYGRTARPFAFRERGPLYPAASSYAAVVLQTTNLRWNQILSVKGNTFALDVADALAAMEDLRAVTNPTPHAAALVLELPFTPWLDAVFLQNVYEVSSDQQSTCTACLPGAILLQSSFVKTTAILLEMVANTTANAASPLQGTEAPFVNLTSETVHINVRGSIAGASAAPASQLRSRATLIELPNCLLTHYNYITVAQTTVEVACNLSLGVRWVDTALVGQAHATIEGPDASSFVTQMLIPTVERVRVVARVIGDVSPLAAARIKAGLEPPARITTSLFGAEIVPNTPCGAEFADGTSVSKSKVLAVGGTSTHLTAALLTLLRSSFETSLSPQTPVTWFCGFNVTTAGNRVETKVLVSGQSTAAQLASPIATGSDWSEGFSFTNEARLVTRTVVLVPAVTMTNSATNESSCDVYRTQYQPQALTPPVAFRPTRLRPTMPCPNIRADHTWISLNPGCLQPATKSVSLTVTQTATSATTRSQSLSAAAAISSTASLTIPRTATRTSTHEHTMSRGRNSNTASLAASLSTSLSQTPTNELSDTFELSTSESLSRTDSRALPVPPPLPPAVLPVRVEQATTAAAATTTVAGALASPAAALQMARVVGVLAIAKRCRAGVSVDEFDQALDFPQSLLPFVKIAPARGQYFRGTIVANLLVPFVLLLPLGLVGGAVVLRIFKVRPKSEQLALDDGEGPTPFGRKLLRSLRLPGSLVILAGLGTDGLITGATVLALQSKNIADDAIYLVIAVVTTAVVFAYSAFAIALLTANRSAPNKEKMPNGDGLAELLRPNSASVDDTPASAATSVLRYMPMALVRRRDGNRPVFQATGFYRICGGFVLGSSTWFTTADVEACEHRALFDKQSANDMDKTSARDLRRRQYVEQAALEEHGVTLFRYRSCDPGYAHQLTPLGRFLARISPYTLLLDLVLTVVVAVSQGLATNDCNAACILALTANLIGVLHALLVRPYSIASKNVLLVAMNGLMFGASVATTRAIKAESEAESTAMAQLASQGAAAAAMLGFVGIGLSLARVFFIRLVMKATSVVDAARLCSRLEKRSSDDDEAMTSVALRAPVIHLQSDAVAAPVVAHRPGGLVIRAAPPPRQAVAEAEDDESTGQAKKRKLPPTWRKTSLLPGAPTLTPARGAK